MTFEKRPVSAITDDITSAADRLPAMAADWSSGQFRYNDVANADDIVHRLAMLVRELELRGET